MILRLLGGGFTGLDWLIAWRHLRAGDERPRWVLPIVLGALYLLIVGLGLAGHAASLQGIDPVQPGEMIDLGGEALLQRYYGAAAGLTLVLAVMLLIFGCLAWFFSLLPTIITMSVLLGCMALVVVLSLMSGLESDLRDKILAQKAHIRISRADGRPFSDYVELAQAVAVGQGIAGASPYLEGEIMVRSGLNRQGAILLGIMLDRHQSVSNIAELVAEGRFEWLANPEQIPEADPFVIEETPWRLRHLEKQRKRSATAKVEIGPKKAETKGKAAEPTPKQKQEQREEGWEDPLEELDTPLAEVAPEPQPEAKPEPEPEPAAPPDSEATPAAVEDSILIGRELAMELGVKVGSQVQLITPIGRLTPAGRVPGVLQGKIAGIFYSGMYEYDRKNVYAPLPMVQAFLRVGDRASGIEVKLRDVEEVDAGKAVVQSIVTEGGRGEELLVEDWRDLNRNLFSAMFLEKVAMFIALLFVVLVASFGILASNLMSVMEKSKEIAILKAMGSSDKAILRVFVAEGLCVGLLGSFAGIALGLALCWALDRYGFPLNESVYYIERLPVVVDPVEVTMVGISALVIVWLSSLYPALVASRMRPVDALRQADE